MKHTMMIRCPWCREAIRTNSGGYMKEHHLITGRCQGSGSDPLQRMKKARRDRKERELEGQRR